MITYQDHPFHAKPGWDFILLLQGGAFRRHNHGTEFSTDVNIWGGFAPNHFIRKSNFNRHTFTASKSWRCTILFCPSTPWDLKSNLKIKRGKKPVLKLFLLLQETLKWQKYSFTWIWKTFCCSSFLSAALKKLRAKHCQKVSNNSFMGSEPPKYLVDPRD